MTLTMARERWLARGLLVLAGLTSSAAFSIPAQAFVRSRPPGSPLPLRWQRPALELVLRTRELPAGIAREQLLDALSQAAAAWSAPAVPCTALHIGVRDGDRSGVGALRDGISSLSVYTRDFCPGGQRGRRGCYDTKMAALTTLAYGDASAEAIAIAEADIELNASTFT